MMGYVFLGLAIIACVAGSSALTASDGMVIKRYGALGVLGFAFSYVLLSRSILTINISIAYAVFCGVGIVLSSIISMVVFKQRMTGIGIACMVLIIAACIIIHLFGSM